MWYKSFLRHVFSPFGVQNCQKFLGEDPLTPFKHVLIHFFSAQHIIISVSLYSCWKSGECTAHGFKPATFGLQGQRLNHWATQEDPESSRLSTAVVLPVRLTLGLLLLTLEHSFIKSRGLNPCRGLHDTLCVTCTHTI